MPLLWLSLAVISGIFLGAAVRIPWQGWAAVAVLAVCLAFIERRWLHSRQTWQCLRRWLPLPLGILLAAFFLGGLRGELTRRPLASGDLAYYNGSGTAELIGWVDDYPDQRQAAVLLRVRIETLQLANQDPVKVRGEALLRLQPGGHWQYGDRLVIYGTPQTPPEDAEFSYRDYLARQGVYTYLIYPSVRPVGTGAGSPLLAGIFKLRDRAYTTINRIFSHPEAALFSGVLLGLDQELPDEIVSAFQQTGTAHIVAISGFNMSVLAALLIGLLGRFLPRGWSALAAAVTIGFYTVLVGANPAVVRAAIMSSLALFGRLIGRGSSGTTPLAFSAAVMVLFNPLLLWDAGFQLSFTATLGLILYGEPLQRKFESWVKDRWGETLAKNLTGPVSEYLLFTLAAQVTTLPVVLYHFNRLSISAVLANPLILPVQPGVMILGGIALIAGMILPGLGQVLAWLAWPLAAYTLRVVEWLARIPFGSVSVGEFAGWMALALYALLFGLTLGGKRLTQLREKVKPGLVLAGLGLVVLVAWSAVLRRPDGRLHLTLLDQPDGQAVVLTMPGGSRILVGGASDSNQLASDLGKMTGPLSRRLNALVMTSASANALQGLPLMIERFPLGQAYWAVPLPAKKVAERVNQTLNDTGTPASVLEPGARLQLDDGVILTVLAVDKNQAALQLAYGNFCAVWPGAFTPQRLAETDIRLDGCLLLADDSIDLAVWQDQHPLQFLFYGAAPSALPDALATNSHGQIEIITDGANLWAGAEKLPR